MPQTHFSDENPHFLLKSEQGKRPEVIREKDPTKKPKHFMFRSGMRKGQLTQMAEKVKKISNSRTKIFTDERFFFVIKFSDSIKAWKKIRFVIKSLNGEITRYIDDDTIKIAVKSSGYENFAEAIEKHRSLISEIRESQLSEKFEKKFLEKINSSDKLQKVTIEVSDLSGFTYAKELNDALNNYVSKKEEKIELGYTTESFAIFSGTLSKNTIKEIAREVEIVESVEPLPEIALISYADPIDPNVSLTSVISLSKDTQRKTFPIICALDSGINQAHSILQGNVVDTYDFTTNNPKPCTDFEGHGSMVSGIIVYGGNHRNNTQVVSKILMVKAFEDARPVGNILNIIDKATSFFSKKTKVYNFSFSANGPNRSITKMLDDLIYQRDLVVVASAGNIHTDMIKDRLENNHNYPTYLQSFPIYFPGDCFNVITVGSSTSVSSNFVPKNSPSPFTRFGTDEKNIKPDILAEGGNLNLLGGQNGKPYVFNNTNVGIMSASHDNPLRLSEGVGTSFSSPAVASIAGNILSDYNYASPQLVKALILSSSSLLKDSTGNSFLYNVQGFGVPDSITAIQSTRWRVCYLLQGKFDGSEKRSIHQYKFLFPSNADKVTITFVAAKPPKSEGYFRFKVVKSGSKTSSNLKATYRMGEYPIRTTGKAVYDVKRGGKGDWSFDVIPFFDNNLGMDKSLKYGCIITVESTKNLEIYNPIADWIRTTTATIDVKQAKEAIKLARQQKPVKIPTEKMTISE